MKEHHQPSRHHLPKAPPPPTISTTSSKLTSILNIRPSAVLAPPPIGTIMPHSASFSHASRAISRPQTRPGVAVAPHAEADALADVRSRTYSAYAAGNDIASGARSCGCAASEPGSWSAVKRVAASRSERGRGVVLAEIVEDGGNGRGAGSGHDKVCDVNDFGVGISRLMSSSLDSW